MPDRFLLMIIKEHIYLKLMIKYQLMDIGISIAIFFALLLALITFFCILTKHFHKKLVQSIQAAAELNSFDESVPQESLTEEQMDYQKFKEQEMRKILHAQSKKKFTFEDLQSSGIKTPLSRDLYSPSLLKRKLINQITPMQRSLSSMAQIQLQRKPTKKADLKRQGSKVLLPKSSMLLPKASVIMQSQAPTQHTFVNKFVSYDSQGLTVVQINVTSIRKLADGSFKQNKKVKVQEISINQRDFQDQLQIFGFEEGDFGCYKYLTKVEIHSMKTNEDYSIKSLKTCQVKLSMEVQDYNRLKIELQNSL